MNYFLWYSNQHFQYLYLGLFSCGGLCCIRSSHSCHTTHTYMGKHISPPVIDPLANLLSLSSQATSSLDPTFLTTCLKCLFTSLPWFALSGFLNAIIIDFCFLNCKIQRLRHCLFGHSQPFISLSQILSWNTSFVSPHFLAIFLYTFPLLLYPQIVTQNTLYWSLALFHIALLHFHIHATSWLFLAFLFWLLFLAIFSFGYFFSNTYSETMLKSIFSG